jgi:MoaA/NifB/PqqE/SkfB family radical SAM enzyme
MYFAPDGDVRACCVNTTYPLGRIGEQSIREIWDGARLAALRDALERDDFSLGCRGCEHRIAAGDRSWSTAEQYDAYALDPVPEFPRRMDFILSNSCNLQCAMCDGELSSSIRLHREKRPPLPPAYGDAFFEELRDFLPHLERSVFLGGEPFVGREPQRVWDLMIELGLDAPLQVVTNGTQWGPRVERYLRELPMSITISVDGWTAETLEPLRVGVDRDRLYENIDRYQAAVEAGGNTLAFHYCLMRQNWHEFGHFLLEADRRDVSTIVMTVTGPTRFSLWDLSPADLRLALESLEREGEELRPQLERNAPVWDAELERIRRHLEAIEHGAQPAWVRSSWEGGAEVAVRIDPSEAATYAAIAERELAAWAGVEPVVLEAVDGVIVEASSVPWATTLDPEAWLGRRLDELPVLLGERLGDTEGPQVEQRPGGIIVADTDFGVPGASVSVRSVATEAAPGRVRVLLASPDPVPTS